MHEPRFVERRARIADRPQPGSIVPDGAPVCTLLLDDFEDWRGTEGVNSPLSLFEPVLSALTVQLEANQEA
jgi:hypothetical protein